MRLLLPPHRKKFLQIYLINKPMINLYKFPTAVLLETMPEKRKQILDTMQKDHLTKLLKNAY